MIGKLLNLVTPIHKKTSRDYLARMTDDKIHCMAVAKRFGKDYWDGNRRYGYGGYRYDGRWKIVAEKLIRRYHLTNHSKILDVGCGKAHLLFEIKTLLPKTTVIGTDISRHGISQAPKNVRKYLSIHPAEKPYKFKSKSFDLVLSLNTLHNLKIMDLETAVKEIERVGKKKYILVESFRSNKELFNLECWALTCQAFFSKDEWIWLYRHFGYTGDFEFIYFE